VHPWSNVELGIHVMVEDESHVLRGGESVWARGLFVKFECALPYNGDDVQRRS